MIERTVYRLYKFTETEGYVECCFSTSPALMATILRACEMKHRTDRLYEVRPELPERYRAPALEEMKA